MINISRRTFIVSSTVNLAVLGGCAGKLWRHNSTLDFEGNNWRWSQEEQTLINEERDDFDIVIHAGPNTRILRSWARPVPDDLDLTEVAARMGKTMFKANGAGLAGPQVGLSIRVATLYLDHKSIEPNIVFARNPVIVERADESMNSYENCLSIPDFGGLVRRNEWVKVEYTTNTGERVTAEAEGFNAVIWQHEIDHLDGTLYIDKLISDLMTSEEMYRLRLY
jgi:peptide deformylase